MSELVVRGVEKSFGDVAVLRGVDLAVPAGSLAAVLGPSGCGKTTLLRLVAGFEVADRGIVSLGGRVVSLPGTHVPPERRRVGVVPQEGALFPHLDVAANVGFGLPRGRRRALRVEEVLELVGLGGYGTRMPYELSGGQQQRVALARALAPEPALVLLDEPFSALDSGLRAAVRADVRAALHAAGATAVLVTHDQEEALSIADLVAVLTHGRIAQAARPDELYRNPVDLDVARFVGDAVVLDAVVDRAVGRAVGRCVLGAVRLMVPAAEGVTGRVVVRPEQLVIGEHEAGDGWVPATVLGTTYYGHDAVVQLTVAGARVAARRHGVAVPLDDGTRVGVRVEGPVPFFAA